MLGRVGPLCLYSSQPVVVMLLETGRLIGIKSQHFIERLVIIGGHQELKATSHGLLSVLGLQ